MKIWFEDRSGRKDPAWRLTKRKAALWVRRVLSRMKRGRVEVGVRLTGDREIRRLNRQYRKKDRATDVLAFALQEGLSSPIPGGIRLPLLGDVVVSVQTAEKQARKRGHPLEREIAVLIIHGLLHLMGYDHERSDPAARRMMTKERSLLRFLEGSGPRWARVSR